MDIREEFSLKNVMPSAPQVEGLSNFFYAFSDGTRLRIIMLLCLKALCVSEIVNVLGINQTTISHQLKILKAMDIVASDRTGKNIIYYIKNPSVEEVLSASVDCIA